MGADFWLLSTFERSCLIVSFVIDPSVLLHVLKNEFKKAPIPILNL